MSDYEVNKLVARKWLSCDYYLNKIDQTVDLISINTYLGAYGEPDEREEKYAEFNPCNDPSSIMPLAKENRIAVSPVSDKKEWCAHWGIDTGEGVQIYYDDENPYRAIAIVYLIMNKGSGENESNNT